MQNRTLGKDLSVSAVGLGCMGFSHGYGLPTEAGETVKLLRRAVDLGYTFFDTAEVYGTQTDPHANETLVGQALAPVRDQVVLSTKFGLTFDFASGKTPLPIVPDSLRRAHKVCPVTAVQNRYSMMARQYESLFPTLEELGIGFVAFSPMANGFLTGQYGKGAAFDPRYDYRSSMPQFTDQAVDQNQALLTLLTTLAQEKGATPAQISLAWMLGKKPWIVPIPGTRKEARMAENAGAAQVALTPQEVAALDQALDAMSMSPVFGGDRPVCPRKGGCPMKVLLVNGSPHKNGCTHAALEEVGRALEGEGVHTGWFWIGNRPLTGCLGCGYCATHGACHYQDRVNEFLEAAKDYDGFVFGAPVHFASAAASMSAFLDRAFHTDQCAGLGRFAFKPGAVVVSARRAGTTATLDQLNKYLLYAQMPIPSSRYWNMVHGKTPEEVRQDKEGMQIMRVLGRNMAWLLGCIQAGRQAGLPLPEQETRINTNYIR